MRKRKKKSEYEAPFVSLIEQYHPKCYWRSMESRERTGKKQKKKDLTYFLVEGGGGGGGATDFSDNFLVPALSSSPRVSLSFSLSLVARKCFFCGVFF